MGPTPDYNVTRQRERDRRITLEPDGRLEQAAITLAAAAFEPHQWLSELATRKLCELRSIAHQQVTTTPGIEAWAERGGRS